MQASAYDRTDFFELPVKEFQKLRQRPIAPDENIRDYAISSNGSGDSVYNPPARCKRNRY